MTLNLPKNVPLLPGNVFSDPFKENFHKTQQFNHVNGVVQEKTHFLKEEYDPNLIDSMKNGPALDLTYGSRRKPENDYIPRIQPPWLKYDRQVLRFYAYFQESVVEDPNENFRIRKCIIYYYLSDGTIFVSEPKIENSGIPQGVFIKRQKIPKSIGKPDPIYNWQDFDLKTNIRFFERVFRIVDCDEFTRAFYEYMNHPLSLPEPQPQDSFDFRKERKDMKINPPDTKEYKEYFEVKLGGGHPNGGLNKYLANDRRVLSFKVIWQDRTVEGGDNFFTLNFFLADDTVEVKEIRLANSGKDPYPLMMRRMKLPKKPILTHYPGMTLKKEDYYGPSDLICGQYVTVYGRECLILSCDEFTQYWYEHNLGIKQVELPLNQEKNKRVTQPVPPYNGYGSEEDSLGSVFSLQPKPPKKDLRKIYTQDQYILRFEARQISEIRDENNRKYIISFYCGDDTIMVYQLSERNSGIWGGKFIERKKFKKPNADQYYVESDFGIGKNIQLSVYQFQLVRADEFTINYMNGKKHIFAETDLDSIIHKIQHYAKQFPSYDNFLLNFLKKLLVNNADFVEFQDLHRAIEQLGIELTLQEQYTLMRAFDAHKDWHLSVKDLFEALGGARQ